MSRRDIFSVRMANCETRGEYLSTTGECKTSGTVLCEKCQEPKPITDSVCPECLKSTLGLPIDGIFHLLSGKYTLHIPSEPFIKDDLSLWWAQGWHNSI